jgi:sodium transport system permease protein
MNIRRAGTIYTKELVDILRDHRTLAAMIVAPMVLYPLLMLGGIQAATTQVQEIGDERIKVGFTLERDWDQVIKPLLIEEHSILQRMRDDAIARGATEEELAAIPEPIAQLVDPKASAQLENSVKQRDLHCGIIVDQAGDGSGQPSDQIKITLISQKDDVRSEIAAERIGDALKRVSIHRRDIQLARLHIDPRIVDPIVIQFEQLFSPVSILGLVLPFILVLMTVTGAIYPAIDLTAGERERGTLESLIVCPVPVIDLVVGKFMAVTTIAMIAASLNIASVTATVFFGGLTEVLAPDAATGEGSFPFWAFPVVLFSLVPFAVLMSAVMLAVCACARTFKEAQNYIMPVIMVVLVPGGIAALPGTRLEGVMAVMPVGNMVLLTRDLLTGTTVPTAMFAWVLLSTSIYAAVAVAVAAQVFGRESVMFADTLSLRSIISRRLIRPSTFPDMSGASLYAAILFPIWFYVQSSLQMASGDNILGVLKGTAILAPLFFVAIPIATMKYWKIDVVQSFQLRAPTALPLIGAVIVGLTAWAPAHEILFFQEQYLSSPAALAESDRALQTALGEMTLPAVLLIMAIIPAISEELFFRGFLLSGLRTKMRPWTAIFCAAIAFGAFHYFISRLAVTMSLGVLLGWMCWRSKSIWPGIVTHALYNGFWVIIAMNPGLQTTLGINVEDSWSHLPLPVFAIATALLIAGIILCRSKTPTNDAVSA